MSSRWAREYMGKRAAAAEPAALSLPDYSEVRAIVGNAVPHQTYRDVKAFYRGGSGMGYGEALRHLGIDVATGKAIRREAPVLMFHGEPVKCSQTRRFADRLRELRGGSDE